MGTPTARTALSYSRIKALECPYRFNALHVAKTHKEGESVPLLMGNLVHKAIEEWTAPGAKMEEVIKRLWMNRPSGLPEEEASAFEDMLLAFRDKHAEGFPHLVEAEAEYAFDIEGGRVNWFDKATFFRLKADRIDCLEPDWLHVTDYKSGWSDKTDGWQLEVYAAGTMLAHPKIKRVTTQAEYVRLGKESPRAEFPRDVVQKTWKRLNVISEEVETRRAKDDWPARPCSQCAYCDLECPLVADAASPSQGGPVQTLEAAEATLEHVVILSRELARKREVLRKWVDARGPVVAAGKEAGYSEERRFDVTVQLILSKAEEVGVRKEDALSLLKPPGATEVDKLAKAVGKLGEGHPLRQLYGTIKATEKHTQKWGERNAGAEE